VKTQQRIPHKWSLNMNQFIVIDGKNAPFEDGQTLSALFFRTAKSMLPILT
jgi:hypothetical protein